MLFNTRIIKYVCRYQRDRLSTESRYSYGVVKNRKEVRPLTEKDFQQTAINKVHNIIKYSLNELLILHKLL